MHKTATKKSYRGKGLPGIFNAFKENHFSNFTMITNEVLYDGRQDKYLTLTKPFAGTFVHWELNKDNRSLE